MRGKNVYRVTAPLPPSCTRPAGTCALAGSPSPFPIPPEQDPHFHSPSLYLPYLGGQELGTQQGTTYIVQKVQVHLWCWPNGAFVACHVTHPTQQPLRPLVHMSLPHWMGAVASQPRSTLISAFKLPAQVRVQSTGPGAMYMALCKVEGRVQNTRPSAKDRLGTKYWPSGC